MNVGLIILLLLIFFFHSIFLINGEYYIPSQGINLEIESLGSHDGWKKIHMFRKPYTANTSVTTYSQVRQDTAILSMLNFKHNGYFIDLAANDAQYLSNSYLLEEYYDWSGLCVEANAMYWESLSSRKCIVVAAAVGEERLQKLRFRVDNGVFGGFVENKFDNTRKSVRRKRGKEIVDKYTVTLEEILKRFHSPKIIDYFSFDVEGAEEFILSSFPFHTYAFKILSVERPKVNLQKILHKNHYECLLQISEWGETFWINKNFISEMNLNEIKNIYNETFGNHYCPPKDS